MLNNDILRSVRNILDIRDPKIIEIAKLTNYDVSLDDVVSFLKKEEDPGFKKCDDIFMSHFLDGLIIYKRGKKEPQTLSPTPAPPVSRIITNNLVLKKLRVAFELKEEDILSLLENAGFKASRPEISAIFRNEQHRNFRPSGDQFLRNFLKGLTHKIRGIKKS